jgi:hypothetical protein
MLYFTLRPIVIKAYFCTSKCWMRTCHSFDFYDDVIYHYIIGLLKMCTPFVLFLLSFLKEVL